MTIAQAVSAASFKYEGNWITHVSDESAFVYLYDVAIDSNKSMYAVSRIFNTPSHALFKFGKNGSLIWDRVISSIEYGVSTTSTVAFRVEVDSSDNIITCGYESGTNGPAIIAKYNPEGTLLWQINLNHTANLPQPEDMTLDASDNIYIVGRLSSPGLEAYVVKLNPSGGLVWQKIANSSQSNSINKSVATDASGNVYVTGTESDSSYVVKYDSSGSSIWEVYIDQSTSSIFAPKWIKLDSNGNIYVAGSDTSQEPFLLKFNSSGSLLWSRFIQGTGSMSNYSSQGLAIDDNDDIYLSSNLEVTDNNLASYHIAKYNSSGTIQWKRALRFIRGGTEVLNFNNFASGLTYDSGNLIFVNHIADNDIKRLRSMIGKLSTDGSLVGIYSGASGSNTRGTLPLDFSEFSYNYSASAVTDGSGTYGSFVGVVTMTTPTSLSTSIANYNNFSMNFSNGSQFDSVVFPFRAQTPQGPVVADSPPSGGGTGGSIAVVTKDRVGISSSGTTFLMSIDIDAGDLGVLVFATRPEPTADDGNGTPTWDGYSVVDSKGNTWTRIIEGTQSNRLTVCAAFSCTVTNSLVANDTFTISYPDTGEVIDALSMGVGIFKFDSGTSLIDSSNAFTDYTTTFGSGPRATIDMGSNTGTAIHVTCTGFSEPSSLTATNGFTQLLNLRDIFCSVDIFYKENVTGIVTSAPISNDVRNSGSPKMSNVMVGFA